MVAHNWHFAEQGFDDVDDENIAKKNFSRESRRALGIFFREFFQNVLDAREEDSSGKKGTASVKIYLRDETEGVTDAILQNYLDGLYPHLTSAGHVDGYGGITLPTALCLEEFGTSGLTGETENSRAKGENERWANFWFGEGKRSKTGTALGRQGQGKVTYHLISAVKTIFAMTHREGDGNCFLFGKCIVDKCHEISGSNFKRHGYWPAVLRNNQPVPSDDASVTKQFASDFDLSRTSENGTSWVIPYVDIDLFTVQKVIPEILRDFFFCVLNGELEISVFGRDINQSTLSDMLIEFPVEGLTKEFIEFLEEAVTLNDSGYFKAQNEWYGKNTRSPMSDEAFNESDRDLLRSVFEDQDTISVMLPIKLTKADGSTEDSSIKAHIKYLGIEGATEEIYVRSGLVIGEEKHLRNSPGNFFGLMFADDNLISEFLGYAEEPSHMRWSSKEDGIAANYKSTGPVLSSVRHSLPKLASMLMGQAAGRHEDALMDILSIPSPDTQGHTKTTSKPSKPKKSGPDSPNPLPPKKKPERRFVVTQGSGDLKITPGDGAGTLTFPSDIVVEIAYETMKGDGNPFNHYSVFDFDLADGAKHSFNGKNASILSRDFNELTIHLTGDDFSISISGFNPNAKIKTKVRSA